jgi:hypothetical protein
MPYMLDQAGTIVGVIMFVISMGLTQLSIARVLDVTAALQAQQLRPGSAKPLLAGSNAKGAVDADSLDYSGIMKRSLGGGGEYLAIASIVVSAWGSCIA